MERVERDRRGLPLAHEARRPASSCASRSGTPARPRQTSARAWELLAARRDDRRRSTTTRPASRSGSSPAACEQLRGRTILEKRRWAPRAPGSRAAAARLRAARSRGHVRLLRDGAGGRGRRSRSRLLPQRRLLDRVRPRDDRAGDLGARRGPRGGAGAGDGARRRRSVRAAGGLGRGRRRPTPARPLPERPCLGRTPRGSRRRRAAASCEWTSPTAAPSTPRCAWPTSGSRSSRPRCRALIELGREIKRSLEAAAGVRPLGGARAAGHLRRDLLAGRRRRLLGGWSSGTSPSSRTARSTARRAGAGPRRGSRSSTRAGTLEPGATLRHLGIVGTAFEARVVGATEAAGRQAVVTEIEGSASPTGTHVFVLRARRRARHRLPAPLRPRVLGFRHRLGTVR